MAVIGKNSGIPFCAPRCHPILYIKNVLRRDDGTVGRETRLYGTAAASLSLRSARRVLLPRQHYTVYDRGVAKRPPLCDVGHDPRYDLVKKPFNVSTSRLRHPETLPESSRERGAGHQGAISRSAFRSTASIADGRIFVNLTHATPVDRDANRTRRLPRPHNFSRNSAMSDSSEDGLRAPTAPPPR